MMDQVTERLIRAGIEGQYDLVRLLCLNFNAIVPEYSHTEDVGCYRTSLKHYLTDVHPLRTKFLKGRTVAK
jgi:hypothetical protein